MNIEPKFIEPMLVDPSEITGKFVHPDWTAKGERRASVALERLDTLWINTGTLCNITCVSCYIESSPTNDRLAYITAAEVAAYLDEIAALDLGTREIGFTGGEPFMNPQILAMAEDSLARGFEVLVLTNAMQPMQRPAMKKGLLRLKEKFGGRLKLRVFSRTSGELIFYRRANQQGPKESFYVRSPTSEPESLRDALTLAYGQTGRVQKHRTVVLVGRTRVHLDQVQGLGDFLELEVVLSESESAEIGVLDATELMSRLGVQQQQLLEEAYVDLLAQRGV